MLPAEDGASEVEPGQPEDFCFSTVRLLKEDGCNFVGVGEVVYDVQFGGGEALGIQLEHCQTLTLDGRDGRPPRLELASPRPLAP